MSVIEVSFVSPIALPVAASDVISVGNGYHSPYNRGQSPYSMESTSPAHTQTTAYHAQQQAAQQMLQVCREREILY